MTLDEAIEVLGKIGVDISKATLNRYVRDGLVTSPERGGYGRGGGRWANYSISAVAEAATAWAMLTKKTQTDELLKELQYLRLTPEMLANARMQGLVQFYYSTGTEFKKLCPEELLIQVNLKEKRHDAQMRWNQISQEVKFAKKHDLQQIESSENELEKVLLEIRIIEEKLDPRYLPSMLPKPNIEQLASIIGTKIPEKFPVRHLELLFSFVNGNMRGLFSNVYAKIYGGMMIRLLNVIPENK